MAKAFDGEIVVDKRYYAPPFVVDVRQEGANDADYIPGGSAGSGGTTPAPELPGDGGKIRLPPTSFTIVSQTVRIAADGRAVVDVLLEVPDVSGVQAIDVRSTAV